MCVARWRLVLGLSALGVLGLGLLAHPAAVAGEADDRLSLQDVIARLAEPAVLRGTFHQERHMEVLSRPLNSSGSFILSSQGLYWHQEQPLASIMIANEDRLVQRIGDEAADVFDADSHPMILPFSRIFLSIFRGCEDELREHFELHFEWQEDNWLIELTPTSYPLVEAIGSIRLFGNQHIEKLTIVDRKSDATVIRFSGLQASPDYLTEHELELYAQ